MQELPVKTGSRDKTAHKQLGQKSRRKKDIKRTGKRAVTERKMGRGGGGGGGRNVGEKRFEGGKTERKRK